MGRRVEGVVVSTCMRAADAVPDGKMPAFHFAHDGVWVYWMLPEAYLLYGDFSARHVAGSSAGEKGAVTIKLQFASGAHISEAFGLRLLEHVSTIGVEQLAKVPSTPRRTPLQIHNLVGRWHFKGQDTEETGQDTEETEEERTARFAAFAAKREAQAKAKAEKAAARAAAREAREAANGGPKLDLTAAQALAAAALEGLTLVPADNATGFMCVTKNGNQFQAEIRKGGVREFLGTFATPQEAAFMVAKRLGIQGSAAAAAAAAGKGSSRKRPAESMAPPESLATTSRSGRRVQAPRRE